MLFSTIETLSAGLYSGKTTSRELVDAQFERINDIDPFLGSYARIFVDEARAAADASDTLRASGHAAGLLLGVPIAVKDLFHYAGHPTEAGSKALQGVSSTVTATCVRRLEEAGMIVLGKTNTVEFAFGGWGTNHSLGTPRNPWDNKVHRVPGGSSSGSAVAVAAGLAPASLGTDTGGSVRIPAGLCGVIGLKSSVGLVGRGGILPLCPTHDSVGPLTRSVRDAALLMQVLAGADCDDPATDNAPTLDYLTNIERGISGLRIAYLDDEELKETAPAIRVLFDNAVSAMERLGAIIMPLKLPRPLNDYMAQAGTLMSAESYHHLAHYVDLEDSLVHSSIRERVLRGRSISASDYMTLIEARTNAQREVLQVMDRIDAFVAPTCPIPAVALSEVDEDQTPLSAYGRFVNFLDFASLSIPVGLTSCGLPAGIQIVVRRFDDPLALRIGRALERDAGFCFRRPPLDVTKNEAFSVLVR